jgi:hypothetical protein
LFAASCVEGVGQFRAAIVSGVPAPLPFACFASRLARRASHFSTGSPSFTTDALGVGQDEETFAFMRRANFRRREKSCLTLVAHCSQVSPNIVEGESKMAFDVLEEDVSRPALRDNAGDFGPEPSGVTLAEPLACGGHCGAGISSADETHSCKWAGIELLQVAAPNRRRLQDLVLHPRQEHGRGVGVPLNGTYQACSQSGEPQPELDPTDSGGEAEDRNWFGRSHTHATPLDGQERISASSSR